MSFSGEVKRELCRVGLGRACRARAEAYWVLRYCNTFTAQELRIITECEEFAIRLPELFDRAFGGLSFDRMPTALEQKYIFQINDGEKLERIIDAFGFDA